MHAIRILPLGADVTMLKTRKGIEQTSYKGPFLQLPCGTCLGAWSTIGHGVAGPPIFSFNLSLCVEYHALIVFSTEKNGPSYRHVVAILP